MPGPPRPWELFYNVTDDVFAMDIEGATLFKRKKTAVAVAKIVDDELQVEEVKLGRGKRVVRSPRRSRKRTGARRKSRESDSHNERFSLPKIRSAK